MCGIFGILTCSEGLERIRSLEEVARDLFVLSESRGREAAGIAMLSASTVRVYKRPVSASRLIREEGYRRLIGAVSKEAAENGHEPAALSLALIGHSRLVTNGAQEIHGNNQPVIAHAMVGVHNGIVVNANELWARYDDLERRYQVDTEIILGLARKFLSEGRTIPEALGRCFALLQGTASVALMFEDRQAIALATNNGSLYRIASPDGRLHVFASERYILGAFRERASAGGLLDGGDIRRLAAGRGVLFDARMTVAEFSLTDAGAAGGTVGVTRRRVVDIAADERSGPDAGRRRPVPGSRLAAAPVPASFDSHRDRVERAVGGLRRCTRCVLPETMPFIDFDADGVCVYCRRYRPIETLGREALEKTLAPYRRPGDEPDCIVAFSGGRDSSYGLHYLTTELGMSPIAYTYDWGMVTDLARRNQARLCGQHGIEHILVSADIRRKHANIRRNVLAWLQRPRLGTIPLFMAGDKQYFYFANELRKKTGIELVVLCENMLEATNFKTGFAGVPPVFDGESAYSLSPRGKLGLAAFYAREYLLNPSYLNRSLLDTLHAFASYYLIPHDYLNLYRYIPWREEEVVRTLQEGCDWETAPDTSVTWRIGDGTASFYNYIYYVLAGFTENDTFRSNQIREGMMSRERALALVNRDNVPRYPSIRWYCDTIGIDFVGTLQKIHRIPPLFPF